MNKTKRKERYIRRERIIKRSWDIVNEIESWKSAHPIHNKGAITFKGDSNLMTNDEFVETLRR